MSLKYLSNFWKTLERPLINCEINHNLTCIDRCVISSATWATKKIKKTTTTFYVSVVTLSTKDIAKLLEKSKAAF